MKLKAPVTTPGPAARRRVTRHSSSRTFTLAQVAALLDISQDDVRHLVRQGTVPAHRRDGRLAIPRSIFISSLSVSP